MVEIPHKAGGVARVADRNQTFDSGLHHQEALVPQSVAKQTHERLGVAASEMGKRGRPDIRVEVMRGRVGDRRCRVGTPTSPSELINRVLSGRGIPMAT